MKLSSKYGSVIAGAAAGAVNGLFSAGAGMILVPLLTVLTEIEEDEIFPSSISIILPICVVSLAVIGFQSGLPWEDAFPYLIGSAIGGILAGCFGKHIPTAWLHRALGVLIIWGGFRYL